MGAADEGSAPDVDSRRTAAASAGTADAAAVVPAGPRIPRSRAQPAGIRASGRRLRRHARCHVVRRRRPRRRAGRVDRCRSRGDPGQQPEAARRRCRARGARSGHDVHDGGQVPAGAGRCRDRRPLPRRWRRPAADEQPVPGRRRRLPGDDADVARPTRRRGRRRRACSASTARSSEMARRYDDEWFAPSWSNDVRGIEAGPYDALVVNDARVTGDPSKASDPAEGAAREFAALLAQRGVTVGGAPVAGVAAARSDHDRVGLVGTGLRRRGRDAWNERRQHGRDARQGARGRRWWRRDSRRRAWR